MTKVEPTVCHKERVKAPHNKQSASRCVRRTREEQREESRRLRKLRTEDGKRRNDTNNASATMTANTA